MTFIDWLFGNGISRLDPSEYMYKTKHIITLLLVVLLSVILALVFRKNKKGQRIVLNSIIGILIFFEITSRIFEMINLDSYTFQTIYEVLMPCHFCSIVVVSIIIAYLIKWQPLINVSVVGGFLATLVFLLYPAVGFNTNIITFSQLYSISSHSLGFIFCVLMVSYKKVDLDIKKIYQPIIYYAGAVLYGVFLNFVLYPGSNYMYFVKNELGIDVSIHIYRLILLAILAFEILCCYIPPLIKKRIMTKKQKLITSTQ
ncbi:MAG: YwaF family protein [Clostridia bacterium]|nr:YwaF family protein [Clostridia bacterium]